MKRSLLLVMLAVFAAGCIGGQPVNTNSNNGLAFAGFSINPSSLTNGPEPVILEAEIENVGGTTARNAQVDFFGIERQWGDETSSLVDSTRTQQLGTLNPPEPARNIPGQTRLVQDVLIPPNPGQGLSHTFTVTARASYDYNTSGFIDIPAISEDEFRRRQINQQGIEFPVSVANSAGPIQMSMDTKFTPIRVDTTSADEFTSWPLRITLTNVGSGFPITPEDDERIRGAGGKITGSIELFGPGAEFDTCLGETSGTFLDLDSTDIVLKIRETGEAIIPCTIRIDNDIWGDRPLDSIKMSFQLFYRYYVDSSASVTVTGK